MTWETFERIRPIHHGTVGGCGTHRKRGEPTCRPCRDAWAAYCRERYHRQCAAAAELTRMRPDDSLAYVAEERCRIEIGDVKGVRVEVEAA